MSDAALRDLERAAREGGDAAAWTRLALEQARAGQDGARAAVQALLLDPAAPVRELLAAGETPGPRALGATLAPLAVFGRFEPTWPCVLDLGQGRAVVVTDTELVAVDPFSCAVRWRRPRDAWRVFGTAQVGSRLVELFGAEELVSIDLATGREAARLALPDVVVRDRDDLVEQPLVALGGARCAALVPQEEGSAVVFCDLERGRVVRSVPVPQVDSGPRELLGAEGAAHVVSEGILHAWDAEGTARWVADVADGVAAELLGVDRGRVVVRVRREWRGAAPDLLQLFGADEGRELLRLECGPTHDVLVGGGLVVSADRGHSAVEVEARSLLDGARSWSVQVPRLEAGPAEPGLVRLRAAGDLLLVVDHRAVPGRIAARVARLVALDRATGRHLWTRDAADDERHVELACGLLLAVGPTTGWWRKTTALRRIAPA